MKKGITPIISIIVLLLITVALAGVAWVYLSGFLGTTTATVTVPPNGAFCAGDDIKVVVTNTGTSTLATLVIEEVSGPETMTGADTPLSNLAPKASTTLTFSCPAVAASCLPGAYTVHLGSSGSVQNIPVTCP